MVKVSIIMACYNQAEYINEAIESVKGQTFGDFECIIVNDGSTDNSLEIINKSIKDDDRFVVLTKKNEGVCETRNYGILHSKGKYILPLDGDDKIGPVYVEEAVKLLDNNDNLKIVYCKANKFGYVNSPWHLPEFSMDTMLVNNCIFNCAFFRREDYNKTVGYNSNMAGGIEDWDFWLSILEHGTDVVCIDKTLFFYRIKGKSRNTSFSNEEYRSKMFRILWSNHKELYSKYCPDPNMSSAYLGLKESADYRIGRKICNIIRLFLK